VLVLSSTLAGGLAEVALRHHLGAWPFDAPIVLAPHLTPQDATLRWRFSPSPTRNSLGLRNREVGPKAPGVVRVLVLGDSLVWSAETTTGALYTEIAERTLNARPRAALVEVVNAGVPGYTTYQELQFLRLYGLAMEPDLVVLGFVFNDVYDPYLHRPTAARLLDREPAILLHRFNTRAWPGWLFARSYLAHHTVFNARLAYEKLEGQRRFLFDRRDDFYLAWTPHGWEAAAARLREMQALLAGRRFAIMIFPVIEQVDALNDADRDYVLYPQKRLNAICHALAVRCLDLTETLRAEGGQRLFRDYVHLNSAGNDLVAVELVRLVETELMGLMR
jgi:lysophospholipase L1-like esterase